MKKILEFVVELGKISDKLRCFPLPDRGSIFFLI